MKATLHYGMFTAQIEVREPVMDLWIVEPFEIPTLSEFLVTNNDNMLDQKIGKLHFQLADTPKIGENLQYRFVGKE